MTQPFQGLSGQLADADIRQLRIFRAVVDNGGFSAAEIDLGMSVAAISIAVADLEKRLGMRLCQRGRAGFSLSDEGAQVYEASLQLLAALENFRTEVNSLHAQLRGELNIAITDNLVTMSDHMRVTNSLAALKRRGPGVTINIRMMPPTEIEKSVLDGRMHVGVTPGIKLAAGLEQLALYDEPSSLYCGHSHPLFSLEVNQLNNKQILSQDAVTMAANMPEQARELMSQMTATASATDREGIAFLILSGEYIGFLPDHYAKRWIDETRMKALLPRSMSFKTPFAAITRKGSRPNLVLQTYLEELAKPENDAPIVVPDQVRAP